MTKLLIISSSLDNNSRSERIARLCEELLSAQGVEALFLRLKDYVLPPFGSVPIQEVPEYHSLHAAVSRADGLILASPVYNWSSCAELKKFIEYVGSTDESNRGAFYDKVVTLVHSAGLPHSYMAVAPLASSLMFDFKCVINPYTVYVHDRHWEHDEMIPDARQRVEQAMRVMAEMTDLLSARTYRSDWGV
ncbi:MAG: NAD(P)H-dependent oxidoreductase [Akkermansiaceae bacterium]|nr:NAD(P)H-dependent oxidoreductase [Armatimonadota bacterium]